MGAFRSLRPPLFGLVRMRHRRGVDVSQQTTLNPPMPVIYIVAYKHPTIPPRSQLFILDLTTPMSPDWTVSTHHLATTSLLMLFHPYFSLASDRLMADATTPGIHLSLWSLRNCIARFAHLRNTHTRSRTSPRLFPTLLLLSTHPCSDNIKNATAKPESPIRSYCSRPLLRLSLTHHLLTLYWNLIYRSKGKGTFQVWWIICSQK
jgi:hypothetical protein